MSIPRPTRLRFLNTTRCAALLVTVLCVQVVTSVAHAGTPSAADIKLTKVIDITTVKGDLTALRDPQSNTIVLVYRDGLDAPRIFVGNGNQFFEQIVIGFAGNPPNQTITIVAPRARPRASTHFDMSDGKYTFTCDEKDVVSLVNLTPSEVTKVVAKATLRSSAIVRRTAVLARDAAGIYYFVDRLKFEFGGSGFRVFVGKRGKLKQLPLVDVADDEAGMVFETKTGEIRLTIDRSKARVETNTVTWNSRGRAKELTWLDPESASYLIKRELGIYAGFGALCDDR